MIRYRKDRIMTQWRYSNRGQNAAAPEKSGIKRLWKRTYLRFLK
ncbi:hypothetical protein FORC69_p123 (plasmid) [Escherichia coli]|nr:hypothetical protein FORC43_p100 [Escherichia coli]AXV27972.1 hypothetical protein FORC69_p123 [Escherichia coli]